MGKLKTLVCLSLLATFFFSSCEKQEVEAPGTNYVTFEKDRTLEVTPDGTSTFEINVYSANIEGSNRTFNVINEGGTADPATYTLGSTVTIPANSNVGKLTLTATDVDLDLATAKTIMLSLQSYDGLSVGDGITLSLLEECLYNKVVLNINFDAYPEELYWAIYDANDDIVATPGPYSAYNNPYAGMSGSITSTLCLEDGTYTFEIYDDWGDGAGAATLSTVDGVVLFSTDGDYGGGTGGEFSLPQ